MPAFHLTIQTPGSASQTGAQFVQAVLDSKQKLATAIAGRVTNILAYGNEDVSHQRSQAVEVLTEALLTNLSSAYSTDTICSTGYKQVKATHPNQSAMIYTFAPAGPAPLVPQRTISILNRDVVLNWQNAWRGVWLTRNELLVSQPSNPAFVYRTAEIRFNSPALPLLVDNQLRDVASIGGTGQARALLDHIKLICNYGFHLITPTSDSSDSSLASMVPVLLYHQHRLYRTTRFISKWQVGYMIGKGTIPFHQKTLAVFINSILLYSRIWA